MQCSNSRIDAQRLCNGCRGENGIATQSAQNQIAKALVVVLEVKLQFVQRLNCQKSLFFSTLFFS